VTKTGKKCAKLNLSDVIVQLTLQQAGMQLSACSAHKKREAAEKNKPAVIKE